MNSSSFSVIPSTDVSPTPVQLTQSAKAQRGDRAQQSARQGRSAWRGLRVRWAALGVVGLLTAACGSKVSSEGPASSQTHWLSTCTSDAQCGDLACLCGICTSVCAANSACNSLGSHAVCAPGATACESAVAQSLCLKACDTDQECGSSLSCRDGACAPGEDPGVGSDASTPNDVDAGANASASASQVTNASASQTISPGPSASITPSASTSQDAGGGQDAGDSGPRRQPDGANCDVNADCESGSCEGMGCGPAEGTCQAKDRACTDDIRAYCGCDGKTLIGGSSCAGGRFEYEGECRTGSAAPGDACDVDADCESGICQGQGCGPGQGVCSSLNPICKPALIELCDCSGETVWGGFGDCPGIRYEFAGACDEQAPQ